MIIEKHLANGRSPLNYVLGYPEGDLTDLPMIVYLHGAGERGGNIENVFRLGIGRELKNGREIPAICLCPQCPTGFIWNNVVEDTMAVITTVAMEYGVKKDRIALTGSSMGGWGAFELGVTYPNVFSAVAPVAGGALDWRVWRLAGTPVRAYHGDADGIIPITHSQSAVAVLKRNGGDAELITMEGKDHEKCIVESYAGDDLIDFLLKARRTNFDHVKDICEEWF